MGWTESRPGEWELVADSFSGKAVLNETNSGFIASLRVENDDFEMELAKEREFFQHRDDAEDFLQEQMQKHDY